MTCPLHDVHSVDELFAPAADGSLNRKIAQARRLMGEETWARRMAEWENNHDPR